MNANTASVIISGLSLLYMAAIVILFAHAVFWLGFSGWWFLMAIVLAAMGHIDFTSEPQS